MADISQFRSSGNVDDRRGEYGLLGPIMQLLGIAPPAQILGDWQRNGATDFWEPRAAYKSTIARDSGAWNVWESQMQRDVDHMLGILRPGGNAEEMYKMEAKKILTPREKARPLSPARRKEDG